VLVGVDRARVVRDLTEAWETAAGRRRMRLVVIEGPTGVGKTALVQALYEQLAMIQPRPAYWPATLHAAAPPGVRTSGPETTGPDDDPGHDAVWRQDRASRIYPEEVAPAKGARLGFFWWGLTARPGGFAALAGDKQIKDHVLDIADAVARGDRLPRERLVMAAKTVSLLASLGGLGPVLATVAANADTARDAVELLRSAPDAFRSRASLLEAARKRNSGTVFSVTARQEAAAGAEKDAQVLGLVARVLPMLVAVEAAQFLDPVTITLLRAVSSHRRAAGLIVLLVDSDQPGDGKPGVPREVLADWLGFQERADRLTRIRLSPLSDQELTEIAVRELGAELDPVMLARVVDYAGGVPGVLYELLDAPVVAEALRGGGDGPGDLAAVPKLAGVRAALAAAPPSTRRVLAVASVHGLMTVRGWLVSSSSSTTALALVAGAGGVPDAVEDAVASGWLRQRPGTQIVEFASPQLLQACRAAQAQELNPAVIRGALRSAVVAARADHSWDDLDWDVRESLLASVVEEDPGAFTVDAAHGELAAELFNLRRATGRDATTRELLAAVTERLATSLAPPGVLTVATAEALFDAGEQDKALHLFDEEFARLQRELGESDTRTLSALHNLAAAHAAAADAVRGRPEAGPLYQAALILYRKLLDHRIKALPANGRTAAGLRGRGPAELVISTRDQYARLLAACYLYQEAIAQGQVLLGEQRSTLGRDHPDTLGTRNNLARWRGEAGDLAGAARGFEELLADKLRVLGPDHPDTLTTRNNLARWRGQAGEPRTVR
jgi:hypothetical protein